MSAGFRGGSRAPKLTGKRPLALQDHVAVALPMQWQPFNYPRRAISVHNKQAFPRGQQNPQT